MAKPYKHPKTGTYYLRRKIPLDVRDAFQGRQLYKQSLNTKNAAMARSLIVAGTLFAFSIMGDCFQGAEGAACRAQNNAFTEWLLIA